MGSLLDSVKNSISPELSRSVAAETGESPAGVRKGFEVAAVTILGALAAKGNDAGFLNQVISLAAPEEASPDFLNLLFGNDKATVEGKIAQAAGISSGAGNTVLASVVPLVLSALASRSGGGGAALGGALTSELPGIRSLIPAGLPGGLLPHLAGMTTARDVPSEKTGGSWLWPVLLLGALLIGALVWYFNRGTAVTKSAATAIIATKDTATSATAAISDATKAAWAKLGDLFKRKLPGGVELSIPRFGVENKLIDWIESSKPVDDTTWFDFDRLLFDTGSATLEPVSQEQLGNVAAILRAYPKVKIKLGGYTDNTGDAAVNLKLSDARAKNVMAELVKLGVAPSRMEAEGYGEEHPAADNNTEEGRQLNRRISLRVTEK